MPIDDRGDAEKNKQFTGGILMKKTVWSAMGLALTMAFGPMTAYAATPTKPAALKIAIVTFFSSSGAVVGGPTADAAKMTIDEINQRGRNRRRADPDTIYRRVRAVRPRTSPSCGRWRAMWPR